MRFNQYLLSLAWLASSLWCLPAPAHDQCPRILKRAAQSFRIETFAIALNSREFADNLGQRFTFDGIDLSEIRDDRTPIGLSVFHDVHGFVSEYEPGVNSLDGADTRLKIDGEENLHGQMWDIFYRIENRGFLSQFFYFAKEELPDGSTLSLLDGTQSAIDIHRALRKLGDADFDRFVTHDEVGQKLVELFRIAVRWQLPDQPSTPNINRQDFQRYVYDIYSQWGRIARRGGYRGNYTAGLPIEDEASTTHWTKYSLPKELEAAEVKLSDEWPVGLLGAKPRRH